MSTTDLTGAESNASHLNWLVTEAIIVAAFSIAGTALAFAYEVGYTNSFFRVPVDFVQIDLLRILGAISTLTFFLGFVGAVHFVCRWPMLLKLPPRVLALVGTILLWLPIWVFLIPNFRDWNIAIAILVMLVLVSPSFWQWNFDWDTAFKVPFNDFGRLRELWTTRNRSHLGKEWSRLFSFEETCD